MGMSVRKTFHLPLLPWVSVHPQRQRWAPGLNEALLLLRLALLFVYSSRSGNLFMPKMCWGWRIWRWNGQSRDMTHLVLLKVEVQWANDFWELQCLESVKDEFKEGIRSSTTGSIIAFREQCCSSTFTYISLKFFLIFTCLIQQIKILFVASY